MRQQGNAAKKPYLIDSFDEIDPAFPNTWHSQRLANPIKKTQQAQKHKHLNSDLTRLATILISTTLQLNSLIASPFPARPRQQRQSP